MYHRRFQNNHGRSIIDFNGRFSLTHLGRGSFLYMLPGKNRPVVGKIELTRKKYRLHGLSLLVVSGLFVGIMLFQSHAGTANSLSGVTGLDNSMNPEDLERKSEEIKNKILFDGEESGGLDSDGKLHIYKYVIQSGDTLSAVSSKFKVGVDLIAASSGIKPYSVLRPGQTLQVPSKPGLVYEIKKGDTLASLAQTYSVKLERISEDNPSLSDMDLVEPGTRIFLPDAKIPAPPSPWVRPAYGRLSSRFGWRRHPLFRHRQMHGGIDIAIYYRPVHAARDGKVVFSGYLGSYGNAVVIQHENGFKTLYAHLSKLKVRSGQYVRAGSVIAVSGNTGMSTGPHLHFEVIRQGRAVNPLRYVHW